MEGGAASMAERRPLRFWATCGVTLSARISATNAAASQALVGATGNASRSGEGRTIIASAASRSPVPVALVNIAATTSRCSSPAAHDP
jgi:hypothetical protein